MCIRDRACSLIKHKRITTTVAKAKAMKKFVEPLITKSKNDTTNSRRDVYKRQVQAHAFSKTALAAIEADGGSVVKL